MIIEDHVITQFETINCFQGIESVKERLFRNKYLVVLEDNGDYKGVLTLGDIIIRPYKVVIDCLTEKKNIQTEMTTEAVAKIFMASDFEVLPVFKKNVFYGVITKQAIINLLLNRNITPENNSIVLPDIDRYLENVALFEYHDVNQKQFHISENWIDVTGIDPLSLHQSAETIWNSRLHPSCLEQVKNEIGLFKQGKIRKIEQIIRIYHPKKGWIWIYMNMQTKATNEEGQPIHIVSFIRDISVTQNGFSEFVSQEFLFEKIFSNTESLVYFKNNKGEFQFVNKAFLNYFNLSREKIINKDNKAHLDIDIAEIIAKNDAETIKLGKSRTYEEHLASSKEIAVFISNKTPVFDSHNNLLGIVGISTNITDIKKIELELINANQKAKEINKKLQQELIRRQQIENENILLKEELKPDNGFQDIICEDEKVKEILYQIQKVAPSDASVMITGETGTGKELVAKAIYQLSHRNKEVFVKINCAAIPEDLIESELFGHEKGAFTGAIHTKIGKFEFAHGGTIFLDEVGDLPVSLQPKLLRVLQENEFERIGSNKTIKCNVRIISATNKTLLKEVNNKKFREDLYYRLNVFPIHLPPLRERKKDIPPLVNSFIKKYATKNKKQIDYISSLSLERLMNYHWPGNIRELENLIERAVILTNGHKLNIELLIPTVEKKLTSKKILTLEEMEREYILKILEMTSWRISGNNGAAAILGIKRTTLNYRMNKLGISYQKHLFQQNEDESNNSDPEI